MPVVAALKAILEEPVLILIIVVPAGIPKPVINSPTTIPVKLLTNVTVDEPLAIVPVNVPPITKVVPLDPVGLYPVITVVVTGGV